MRFKKNGLGCFSDSSETLLANDVGLSPLKRGHTSVTKIIHTISFLIKRSQNEGFFRFRRYKNDHYVMYYLHYKNQCYWSSRCVI